MNTTTQAVFDANANRIGYLMRSISEMRNMMGVSGDVVTPASVPDAEALYKQQIDDYVASGKSSQTFFSQGTPLKVRAVLAAGLSNRGSRFRIWLGSTKTGRAWTETNDVMGSIGRSTGALKVPLLIPSARSSGGGAILTDCVVRIDHIESRQTLYKHPEFHTPRFEIVASKMEGYLHDLLEDGEVWGRFDKQGKAEKMKAFLEGHRYSYA